MVPHQDEEEVPSMGVVVVHHHEKVGVPTSQEGKGMGMLVVVRA